MQLQTGSVHFNILHHGLSCVLHHTTRATNSHRHPIMSIDICDNFGNNSSNVWPPLVDSDRSTQGRSGLVRLLLYIGIGSTWNYRANLGVRQLLLLKRIC
jgi:hypothetical protein